MAKVVFFLFLVLCAPLLSCAAPSAETQAEIDALTSFRLNLHDPQGALASWDTSSPAAPCDWRGVSCSDDRVTELRLPRLQLGGRLSDRLANLRMLRKLSLRSNSFNGSIPPSLSKCTLLRSVFFQYNYLSGKLPASLPFRALTEKLPSTAREMSDDEKVKNEALQIIAQFRNLPRLIVFDLDYTLWPLYCEFDYKNPHLYAKARGVLNALKEKGIDLAVASRTPTPDIANRYLRQLGLQSMFVAKEIYPSSTHKTGHFKEIHKKTGVPYTSMLFFDDESRNIREVSKMGVTSILVDDGVSLEALRQGLAAFSQKSGSS